MILADVLCSAELQATPLLVLFRQALRADLAVMMARDPAACSTAGRLLYSKEWHELQSYLLAHWLWRRGRQALALYLQRAISSCYAVDLHPTARIARASSSTTLTSL